MTGKIEKKQEAVLVKKKNSLIQQIIKAKWIYISIAPSFLMLGLFNLYPAINAIIKSFYFWKSINMNKVRFIGLENYIKLFSDTEFWKSFGNLSIFILMGFLTTFLVLMPVTHLVYQLGGSFWGRWLQRLYVVPMMVPGMVIILFWRFFYDYHFGILNTILKSIGLQDYMRVWLGDKSTALPSLLFFGFPWVGGFGFLILLAGFQSIDASLHEASELDGANGFQKFIKIDIPLIMPQAKVLIILGMISGIQQYGLQMIMTNGGPQGATTVPGLLMYQTAFSMGNMGYGSTMGVALFGIILLVTLILNKFIKNKE